MRYTKKIFNLFLVIVFSISSIACVTTHVVANDHSSNISNEACQEVSQWKYWWGLGGPDEIRVGEVNSDTKCPCRDYKLGAKDVKSAMASVEVKNSFGDALLSLITLGIVNHRTVKFKCAEIDEGEQNN